MLLSFSVSLAFFNHAHIYASVPLVYPPLLYLLVRMLAIAMRAPARRAPRGCTCSCPRRWLALGVVFLIGFRVALNVTDSNVIDVGYAGVIGAQRIVDGKPLYGSFPSDNEHGDTYGPVNYEAYVPFEQIFGWSGTWDDLPAAHAAAIAFDLLAVALLFLLGRRVRGPTLGVALAYAWVVLPVHAVRAREQLKRRARRRARARGAARVQRTASRARPPARGALAALAGLTKFAPLALAPLLATHGCTSSGRRARARRARAGGCSRSRSPPRRRSRRSRRSATIRCTRSTSARSPIRPTAARRSRCGACTAASARVEPLVQIGAVVLASRSRSSPAARTWSGWRRRARR